jgi:hypothetical protein
MFRSSSFAFFEMLRACCDPQPPRFCCTARRKHDVHCGSSDDLLTDAIEKGGSALGSNVSLQQ